MSNLTCSQPDAYIDQVFGAVRAANWHVYQVLTKRPERMREATLRLPWLAECEHIWLGVSVENRKHGLARVEPLRQAKAAVRFLSVEPLLEDLGPFDLTAIRWVIVGGESGPHARPMAREWVLSVRDQCAGAGVSFFFKQWGGVRKRRTGRLLDGRTYDGTLNVALAPPPPRKARHAQARELESHLLAGVPHAPAPRPRRATRTAPARP